MSGSRSFVAELMAMAGAPITNFHTLSLSIFRIDWSTWPFLLKRVFWLCYLSLNLLPDNYLSINAKFINLHLFWQPVGLGKIAKLINAGKIDSSELITMKTLKVHLLPSLVSKFEPFPFLYSLWLILAIPIAIGYNGNRKANKRWSKIDGTRCWTNQVANSSGGESLS